MRGYKAISDWADALGQQARERFDCRRENGRYVVPSEYVPGDQSVPCPSRSRAVDRYPFALKLSLLYQQESLLAPPGSDTRDPPRLSAALPTSTRLPSTRTCACRFAGARSGESCTSSLFCSGVSTMAPRRSREIDHLSWDRVDHTEMRLCHVAGY